MIELSDPELKKVKAKYDSKLLAFIREHAEEILEQMDKDLEYQSCNRDVPRIPLFDTYLSGLEEEIKKDVSNAGFFNGTTTRLMRDYNVTFYYSSLPNLSEHRAIHERRPIVDGKKKSD